MKAALRFLGGVSVEVDGKPLSGKAGQRHRLALLALLSTAPSGLSRDRLVGLLWPEADAERARRLLSNALYALRQGLGDNAMLTVGDTVRLNPEHCASDVLTFDAAVRAGAHEQAVATYGGAFLDGFFLADNPEFEQWVDGERASRARAYATALEALALQAQSAGDIGAAVEWWQRLASHDPYNSRTALRLMRALEAAGDPAGALRHARAHEALLHQQMGVAAPAEVSAEVERLKAAHADTRIEAVAPLMLPPVTSRRARLLSPRSAAVAFALIVLALGAMVVTNWPKTDATDARPVVAVLPFKSLSADSQQAYFSDGLTDLVITELARVPGLAVISRTSIDEVRGQQSAPQIAAKLNAQYLVEGTVLRDSGRVRINVQLIDGRSDKHVWADKFDREWADVFALHSDVARGIAERVGVAVKPAAAQRTGVRNVAAYEAFLKGVFYSREAGLRQGIEWFEQAIALDSTFAPAYAGIARNVFFLGFFGVLDPKTTFERMRGVSTRAIALDESMAEAHGTLALVLMHWDQDWKGAEQHFRRALELDPNNAQIRHDYAHLLLARNRLQDATTESQRAIALDPVNPGLEACLGWHHLSSADYEAAVQQSLRAVSAAPLFFWAHHTLGWGYEQMGKYPEAISSFGKAVELSGGLPFTQSALAHALAASGDRAAASELLKRITAEQKTRYVSPYDLAAIHAGLGDRERALDLLAHARVDRSAQLIHLGWDQRFARLHDDPRFTRLLRELGLNAWLSRTN